MSEPNVQQNTGKPGDEIDIFEFCSRIWNAFLNFLISIRNLSVFLLIFLTRKSLWIISFALFGIVWGYVLYGGARPYYSSSLEANTGVDNAVVIDHINKLNLATGKPSLLANYLGMSVEQAGAIRSIKACYGTEVHQDMKPDIRETYKSKDTMLRRVSVLYVNVSVYDESVLPALRKGLLQYINNNTYIQDLFRIDRRQKRELLTEIEKEIGKIDSLQRARIYREAKIDKGQLVIMGSEPEIKLFYPDMLALYDQKQMLEKNMEISDKIIVVVQDFTPLQQEIISVRNDIVRFGISMAVAGLICALLWQYRKRIWTLIREDSTKR
ncbi:MAG: hypothetical protein LBL04_11555 [Bacteroidales bacterium]|jgi:hypothetical protein|nr:hypothetical protein [Bacteroidales bacterium]